MSCSDTEPNKISASRGALSRGEHWSGAREGILVPRVVFPYCASFVKFESDWLLQAIKITRSKSEVQHDAWAQFDRSENQKKSCRFQLTVKAFFK